MNRSGITRGVWMVPVAATVFIAVEARAMQLPAAVRLARKLEARAVEALKRASRQGGDAAAESRRALHSLTQARDVLIKKRSPRPQEYVEELETVRALAYWISRRTPTGDVGGLDRLYLPKGPPEKAARELFDKTGDFGTRRRSESFVIAARYFEVADRYPGTNAGRKARAILARLSDGALPGGRPADTPPPRADDRRSSAPKSRRELLVEELVDMLRLSEIGPEDKLDACEKFLRELPGDPLVREVAALMDIFAATAVEERMAATRDYLDLFPQGYFAKHLPKVKDEASEGEDFDALVFELRSNSPPSEKERACRRFYAAHSGGVHGEEAAALLKVFAARSQDQRMVAWLNYRAAFPGGVLRTQSEEQLRRSEPLLLVQMKQALVDDDDKLAQSVGGVYLDLFPRGPAVAEIRHLFEVLQKPKGAARAWAAEKYIEQHRDGTFAPILRKVVGTWRRRSEEADYKKMQDAFLATDSEAKRVKAIDEFIKANPSGAHAAEMRGLRAVFSLRGTKGRLNAARKYLKLYPGSGMIEAVRGIGRDLETRHEKEFYDMAVSSLRSRGKTLEAKLGALEEYLEEHPEGAHAAEIRASAQSMRRRIADEDKAFIAFEKRMSSVSDPAEGLRLCDEFRDNHPGGAHLGQVMDRRRVFERRVLERQEVSEYEALSRELTDAGLSNIERTDKCIAYVGKYPGGKYKRDVRAAMAEFAPQRLPSHAGEVRAAAFTRDSTQLVTLDAHSGSRGSGVWVWELPAGRLVARFTPRPLVTAESAAFSPEGDVLWICESSGGLLSWALPDGEVVGRYRLGWGALKALGVSDDELVAVTASYRDPKARSWDVADWQPEGMEYPVPGGAATVAVTGGGDLVAVGGRGGALAVYEVGDDEPLWTAEDVYTAQIDQLAFSADGRRLVSASGAGGLVCMWEADNGEEIWRAEEKSTSAAFAGGDLVVTGPSLRRASDGDTVASLGGDGPVAASPDGRFAFTTGEESGSAVLWYLPALVGR